MNRVVSDNPAHPGGRSQSVSADAALSEPMKENKTDPQSETAVFVKACVDGDLCFSGSSAPRGQSSVRPLLARRGRRGLYDQLRGQIHDLHPERRNPDHQQGLGAVLRWL